MLKHEGAAQVNSIMIKNEILKNEGANIGISGLATNHPHYESMYNLHGDTEKVYEGIAKVFGATETTSNTKQIYNDYYGDAYDKWKVDHDKWKASQK